MEAHTAPSPENQERWGGGGRGRANEMEMRGNRGTSEKQDPRIEGENVEKSK